MAAIQGPPADPARAGRGFEALRIVIALLILIHGIYRLTMGGVAPFGQWLGSIGFPAGYALALAVTLYELVGPVAILLRRYVALAALGHIFILTLGMILVHMPFGWFVVGAGRNGMEYSVVLIAGLAAIAWAYWPRNGKLWRS
jgi:putative oxidoreductase